MLFSTFKIENITLHFRLHSILQRLCYNMNIINMNNAPILGFTSFLCFWNIIYYIHTFYLSVSWSMNNITCHGNPFCSSGDIICRNEQKLPIMTSTYPPWVNNCKTHNISQELRCTGISVVSLEWSSCW
jgi:hypothetical protein